MNDYQEQYDLNKERNDEFLNLFRQDLEKHGLKEKSIEGHLENVDFYINDYLPHYEVYPMEEGCSYQIMGFLGDFFIRKCCWSTPNSIKNYAKSIKKFYKCMVENEFVSKEDYKVLTSIIKDEMENWQKRCEAYNNGDENWDCDNYEEGEALVPVMIEDVVDAFLTTAPNWEQYYDVCTGEIIMLPMYYEDFPYSDEQDKLMKKVDEEEGRYIVLPNLDIVDAYSLMKDYADNQEDAAYGKELNTALAGKRALYDFMKLVQDRCDLENYNFFKVETIICTMIEWAIEYELPCDSRNEDIKKLIDEMVK